MHNAAGQAHGHNPAQRLSIVAALAINWTRVQTGVLGFPVHDPDPSQPKNFAIKRENIYRLSAIKHRRRMFSNRVGDRRRMR